MAFAPNPGEMPPQCLVRDDDGKATGAHRRVIVKLCNGTIHGSEPVSTTGPKGWDARTTRWSLTGHPYDIVEWELA